MTDNATIEPGVYPDMPPETYYGLPYASNSRLSLLAKSPAHLREALDNPDDDDSDALKFGREVHVCILEPERFDAEYAIGPDVKMNTKAGKAEWEEFANANVGKELIRGGDAADMLAMRDAVWSHKVASSLLGANGNNEVSFVWDDPDTGVRCKSRLDGIRQWNGFTCFADLKGVRDSSPRAMSKAVANYGWHKQAAMYLDSAAAIDALRGRVPRKRSYNVIAVQKTAPYCVVVYDMNPDAIDAGRRDYKKLLKLLAKCRKNDHWPGYSDDKIEELNLPGWAVDNWEDAA